ncbi:MAG: hypothetical protein K8F91_09550, partial [Candidatus Obscuribacterales bacterium]|nr:hypothetical protein [Candidatus Obscuribacterales bacterium]
DAIGLHPVLIFIAIMIGARLDGMLGIIVSLPIAGAAGVLIRYVFRATDPTSSTDNQDEKICDEKSGACGEG